MTDLYETMSTLRAVRRLRTDPIPGEVLERVLQAGCWAPTGGNQQPWRVVVVRDELGKRGLHDIYEPLWTDYIEGVRSRAGDMSDVERQKWERSTGAGDHLAANLSDAPAILVFCANPKAMAITDIKLDRVSMVGGGSVYPAVQNVMLACVAEGLGCTLTTLHCRNEEAVKDLLEIPQGWATVAMVPIGYPVLGGHGPITRKPPADMAFADRFGTAWER